MKLSIQLWGDRTGRIKGMKDMAKGFCVERVELAGERCGILELGYYVQAFCNNGEQTVYGIKIEKTDTNGDISSEETYGLTQSCKEAEGWVRKLAAGTVTPLSLHAIVDDLVGC